MGIFRSGCALFAGQPRRTKISSETSKAHEQGQGTFCPCTQDRARSIFYAKKQDGV